MRRRSLCRHFPAKLGDLFEYKRIPFDERRREFFDKRPIPAKNVFRLFIATGKHGATFRRDTVFLITRTDTVVIIMMEQRKPARRVVDDETLQNGGSSIKVGGSPDIRTTEFEFHGGTARKQRNDALMHFIVRTEVIFALNSAEWK